MLKRIKLFDKIAPKESKLWLACGKLTSLNKELTDGFGRVLEYVASWGNLSDRILSYKCGQPMANEGKDWWFEIKF